MNKEVLKNKCIYFFALSSMCLVLAFVAYLFFLRQIDVNVMTNAQFQYIGENGGASLKVINATNDLNQRTQEFMESVVYEVSPNTNLSNGDIVHVKATYSHEVAEQYHFHPTHIEQDFVVEGLNDRYENIEDIDKDYLKNIQQSCKDYIKKHQNQIYQLDGEDQKSERLVNQKVVYSAFLKSKTTKSSDRYIEMYELQYEMNDTKDTILYVVCVPEINDGNIVQIQDIYGEKAYLNEEELNQEAYGNYINRVFANKYDIEVYEKE